MINWLMINYLPSLVLYELFYFCGVYAVVVGWMVSFVFLYMVLCVVNWRCLRLYISQPVMLVLCLSVKVMANSHGWRSTLPFLCGATFTLCRPNPHSLSLSASVSSFWATFALCRPNPHSLCVFYPPEPHSLCADPTLSLSLYFFLLSHIHSVQTQPSLSLPLPLSVTLFLPSEPTLSHSLSHSVSLCISSFWATFALCRPSPLSLSLTLSVCLSVCLSLFLPSEAVPVLLVLLYCTGLLPLHHPPPPPPPPTAFSPPRPQPLMGDLPSPGWNHTTLCPTWPYFSLLSDTA